MSSLSITFDRCRSPFVVSCRPCRLVWDVDDCCNRDYATDDDTTWSERITQLSDAERCTLKAALVDRDRALIISILTLSADNEMPSLSLIASVLDAVEHPVMARTDNPRDSRLDYWMGTPTS